MTVSTSHHFDPAAIIAVDVAVALVEFRHLWQGRVVADRSACGATKTVPPPRRAGHQTVWEPAQCLKLKPVEPAAHVDAGEPVEGSLQGEATLKRTLTAKHLILLGMGAVIGAGIFVVTGQAAANHAGPAIMLSFVLAGLACAFAGLCYAEFAAMMPVSGSAYSYSYATMGEGVAWFIGWCLVLEYLFASASVAVGWSAYLISFLTTTLNLPFPDALTAAPIAWQDGHFISSGNPANWTPFIPANTGTFGEFGWSGVLRAASIVFFAYIGFDAVSTAAGETKDPQRNMPIGLLGSLAVCTLIYIIVCAVLTGLLPYHLLGTDKPVATALSPYANLAWLKTWVEIGAIAGLSSVVLVMMMGQTRIAYTISRDGLLPPLFGRVHAKYRTPYISTIIVGVLAATLAGLVPLNVLGELVAMGTLLAFATVCIGILVLRRTKPDINRPFRVPAVWLVAPLGALICLGPFAMAFAAHWLVFVLWTLLGLCIYFGYGIRHSKLNQHR